MSVLKRSNNNGVVSRVGHAIKRTELWEVVFLSRVVPVLLAVVLGVLLALFIVGEQWHLVIGISLLVPSLILFNTFPLVSLLIWLLVNPFLQTAPNDIYRMVYWIIHRAIPPLALGIIIVADMVGAKERRRVKLGRAELAMAAFLAMATLNSFWFHRASLSYLYLVFDRIFVPMCLYLLVRLLAPHERELRYLLPVALVILLVECIVGILSWFAPEILPSHWLSYIGYRTTGTLRFPHAYTTTLVFFAFLLFHDATHRAPGAIRSIFLFAFGLAAVCVFLSFSRGSWLGMAVATVGLVTMYPKMMLRMIAVLLIIMVLLGNGLLSSQMAFAQERMSSEDTAKDRLVIWNAGFKMALAKPFFGWGYADYTRFAAQFEGRVGNYVVAYTHASHNSFLTIAAELGVPALFLFLLPVLHWLRLTFKVWPRLPKTGFWSRQLLVVLWMVILDHITVSFFSDMLHSTYGMGIWWITLGLIAHMVDTYLEPEDRTMPEWVRQAAQVQTVKRAF